MAPRPLHDFVEEVSGESHLRVEHDFGDGFVRLHTSEAERRQAAQDIQGTESILLEMMRNSKDAHSSHIFIAAEREGARRTLTVIDDGEGIPPSMHRHIFEPRVTSKLDTSHKDAWGLHGRGMALYSIAVNAQSAQVLCSQIDSGAAIQVVTDTSLLPERADQSSFPTFTLGDDGHVSIRGPRNLLRTACEFAIEARKTCAVHLGSPAEIAAALLAHGSEVLSPAARAFCRDVDDLPLVQRLATASDPADLALLAASLGLNLSERTARRILDGQVKVAPALLDRIVIDDPAASARTPRKPRVKAAKPLHLSVQDTEELSDAMARAFAPIAESYYLEPKVQPRVSVGPQSITVSIPIVHAP